MKTIRLRPVRFTRRILSYLDRKGLVRPLRPALKVKKCRDPKGAVGNIYVSGLVHGGHKLISIRCTTMSEMIVLNSHPDNEEFILLSPDAHKYSPLYMVISLCKHGLLEKKIRSGSVSHKDFLAVELVYNDPVLSVFTMLKGTVHFEAAVKSRKEAPVFFVSEPSRLRMDKINMLGNKIEFDIP